MAAGRYLEYLAYAGVEKRNTQGQCSLICPYQESIVKNSATLNVYGTLIRILDYTGN